jgi:magnesium chelatase family protein
MLAKLHTFSLVGIDALSVEVEVDVSPGALPKTVLVGLPEAAVKESTHRVERAMVNSGFMRPQDKIVINLAPAELPKNAASFDLPISLGMLAGSGQLQSDLFEKYAVVGELALDGGTRTTKGALSMAMAAAQQKGLRGIVVPTDSAADAQALDAPKGEQVKAYMAHRDRMKLLFAKVKAKHDTAVVGDEKDKYEAARYYLAEANSLLPKSMRD